MSVDELVALGRVEGPDLIKIDVEGAELGVLKGAIFTLRAHRPDVFIECHSPDLRLRCAELLQSLSYTIREIGELSNAATGEAPQISHLAASSRCRSSSQT